MPNFCALLNIYHDLNSIFKSLWDLPILFPSTSTNIKQILEKHCVDTFSRFFNGRDALSFKENAATLRDSLHLDLFGKSNIKYTNRLFN